MGQPKIWNDTDDFFPDVADIHEGDLRVAGTAPPYTLQIRQSGAWVDFFPRLEEDGLLSIDVMPISIIPPFDIEKSVKTFEESNSTTTLVAAAEMAVPVTLGKHCRFVARILYAAESNIGARFTVNGTSTDALSYTSRYPLTATTETVNHCDAYQQPAAANASSPSTTGNLAIVEGIVLPDVDGYIWVEFASAGGDAITMLAGSHLYTEQFFAAS